MNQNPSSVYGLSRRVLLSTLVVLALASPAARPRLLERLKTIEKRLKKRLRAA
jgi:hypothetical protein